ncbi:ABC transporter substrate-binding protein [Okibacterium endophyticum]
MTPAADGEVDSVTWGMVGSEPTTLDPILVGTIPQNTVTSNLCESLLQLQPDFSVDLGLAETFEQPDDRTIIFSIRDGVTFWNGDPLTADDVAYSLGRNMDPSTGAYNSFLYQQVASIEATAPLEVTVTFTSPDANFLAAVAGLSGAISQRAAVEAAGQAYGTPQAGLMCTGPYALGDWAAGEGIDIVANHDYWNPDLQPMTETIHFDALTNESTLVTALRSGEIDGAYNVPPSGFTSLANADGTLYFGPSSQYFLFGPVDSEGPGADPRVRQALSLAFDREAFVKNILNGAGEPLHMIFPSFVTGGHPAADVLTEAFEELETNNTADVEAAKAMLADVDVEGEMSIVIVSGDQVGLSAATLMQAAAKEIGLTMNIQKVQESEMVDIFYNDGAREGVDFLATSGYFESPTILSYASTFIEPGGLTNFIGYDNPEALALLQKAKASTDPTESAKALVEAQASWYGDRLTIPVAVQYERLYLGEGLTGVPASQAYVSYPWAALLGAAE